MSKQTRSKTPTFLLELPLQVEEGQAKRLQAHLEVARLFYNAVLSEGQSRLRRMKADPAWQAARAIPRSHKEERAAAFSALREQYGFSEYALHEYAKAARCTFLAEHLDAVLAQTPATLPSWGSPTTSPSIRWEATPLAPIWDHPPSPWLVGKEKRASRRWVKSSPPMRSRFAVCSARWTGKGERPIQSTTTNKDGSRNKARNACRGRPVAATSGLDA